MEHVFNIPTFSISKFKAEIEALNKKAMKLMGEKITYAMGLPFTKKVEDHGTFEFTPVTVSGPSPKLNGWNVKLVMDHGGSDGGLIVTNVGRIPTEEVTPWFSAKPICEHCNTNRRRNFTFLLEKEGQQKQVGKTCLKDFTGHKSPEDVAAWASNLFTFFEEYDDEDRYDYGGQGSSYYMLNTELFLRQVAFVVKEDGRFITRKMVEENHELVSTSSVACSLKQEKFEQEIIDMAEQAREYCLNLTDDSEFTINLKNLLRGEFFSFKYTGIVAYAIEAYRRHVSKQNVKRVKTNEYVGEVGKRYEFSLKQVRSHYIYGDDYTLVVNVFEDDAGRTLVWTTGRQVADDGTDVVLKGTIKAHEDYKGTHQTVLTRCRVQ